jgi:hypothetical protein
MVGLLSSLQDHCCDHLVFLAAPARNLSHALAHRPAAAL